MLSNDNQDVVLIDADENRLVRLGSELDIMTLAHQPGSISTLKDAEVNKADLFISVHTNALPAGRLAYGSETYTLGMARANANLAVAKRENAVITLENDYKTTYQGFDPNKAESYVIFEFMQDKYMKQSVDLASCIQKQYVSTGRPNKGVHQAGFLVLRNTSMPSVLTELVLSPLPLKRLTSTHNKA